MGWTPAEAKRFFEWVKESVEPRSEVVLAYLGIPFGRPVPTLEAVGARIHELLTEQQFARPPIPGAQLAVQGYPIPDSSWTLTDEGNAIAADVGLLQANYVLRDFAPRVRWSFVEKPRNSFDYRRPCLVADETPAPMDVLFGSISAAHALLEGIRTSRVWADRYLWFAQHLETSDQTTIARELET
jgi:hypothetical protein